MKKKVKREYSFDILRVVAMIMVIIIHVSNVYSRSFDIISNSSFLVSLIFNTFSRISVPIFLMISGALLLDREFNKEKYLKRLLKFFILIVVWDIIYLIWEYLYLGITYGNLFKLIFEPYRAHLWFLYTILLLYAIQPLLRIILNKLSSNAKVALFCIWTILSSASLVSTTLAEYFTIFTYIGFFVLGKHLYELAKDKNIKKYNIPLILIVIICIAISVGLNYSLSIKYQVFYNLYFAYRTPFIILASFAFYVLIIGNYRKDSLNKYLMMFSDLSLGVYLIHGIFLDITVETFTYHSIHSILGIPLFTTIIFICSIISVYLLRKIKIFKNLI